MKSTAIALGRVIQSGLIFLISLAYISYAENTLFVSFSYNLAIGAPIALLIMYGGYIEATQIVNKSKLKNNISLIICLIYRPFLLLITFYLTLSMANFVTTDKIMLTNIVSFLVCASISDILLFRRKYFKFLYQIIFCGLTFSINSYLILIQSEIQYMILLLILNKIHLFMILNISMNLTTLSLIYSKKNFVDYFIIPLKRTIWLVASSAILGIFLGLDRIILVNFNNEMDIRHYVIAITLTIPINFLATLLGKKMLLNNYFKNIEMNKKNNFTERFDNKILIYVCMLNILILPVQKFYAAYIDNFTISVSQQILLNISASIIVVSKPFLANLYFNFKQRKVTYATLAFCVMLALFLVLFDELGHQASIIRVSIFTIYIAWLFRSCMQMNKNWF